MEAKEFKEHIKEISSFFIEHFDRDVKLAEKVYEVEEEGEDRDCRLVDASLAIGFAVGQFFEVTDAKICEHLDAIKQAIREKGLLPYLPRERKAA